MGTEVHVIVVDGEPRLLERARASIERLEAKWSRFRPTSELSQLNRAAGRTCIVSTETFEVVNLAVQAWYLTGGRFDPTVHDALVAAGYDRTFREIAPAPVVPRPPTPVPTTVPTPGCAAIALAPSVRAITLPPGVALDLGGIGKGRAADLVTAELTAAGAAGASVSIGGDVRVTGSGLEGGAWEVGVESPFEEGVDLATLAMADGAVVTSTRLFRTWQRDGLRHHHLIDPATGSPAWTGLAAVTVVAGQAATGEVMAKAAYLAGAEEGAALLAAAGLTGLLVEDTGAVRRVDNLEVYAR